jgi:hypothetical protein
MVRYLIELTLEFDKADDAVDYLLRFMKYPAEIVRQLTYERLEV